MRWPTWRLSAVGSKPSRCRAVPRPIGRPRRDRCSSRTRPRASRSASRSHGRQWWQTGHRARATCRVAGHEPSPVVLEPRPRCRHGQSGPGGLGRRSAVVTDRTASRCQVRVRSVPSNASVDAERLTRAVAGPLRARSRGRWPTSRRPHRAGSPAIGATRPQQHRGAFALVAADRVRAPVHAVGEVHVQVAGGTEHRGVACCSVPGRRGWRGRRRPGTPRPRRCGPDGLRGTSTLLSRSGRDDPGVTPVEVTRERLQCDSASRDRGRHRGRRVLHGHDAHVDDGGREHGAPPRRCPRSRRRSSNCPTESTAQIEVDRVAEAWPGRCHSNVAFFSMKSKPKSVEVAEPARAPSVSTASST